MMNERTPPDLAARLGAVLFALGEPVDRERLLRLLACTPAALDEAIAQLRQRAQTLGLWIIEHGTQLQLVTDPALAHDVETALGGGRSGRLSPAALETLAIVAYCQPVTRAEIDALRGVDSTAALQTLLNRGLIEPVGRAEQPGAPVQYGTTALFLQSFGLASREELPPLPEAVATWLRVVRR